MPQQKPAGDGLAAMRQGRDLEQALRGERHGGFMDEAAVAVMLGERGAALGFPAIRFQRQKSLERARDLVRRGAMPNSTGPSRRAGCAGGEVLSVSWGQAHRAARSRHRRWHRGARARGYRGHAHDVAAGEGAGNRGGGRTVLRQILKQDRAGAGPLRGVEETGGRLFGRVAIEQRRRQRCISLPRDKSGERQFQRAPCRHDRQQPDQGFLLGAVPNQ